MAPLWELAIPEPSCLSLLLLSGFLIWGFWMLFSGKLSRTQATVKADAEISKQHKLKDIQKFTAPQWEENLRMNFMEGNLTCLSGFPMGWAQEYILWSMDRSLQQIFQHLENARSSLMELCLPESQNVIASSTSSVIMTQEPVPPSCDCKKAKHIDQRISSGTSSSDSSLSHLPVFSETNWQFRSSSLPTFSTKKSTVFRDKGSSLPSLQLSELGKPTFFQNLEAFSPLMSQNSFTNSVFECSDVFEEQKKTKAERRSKSHLTSDQEPGVISEMRPQFPECTLIQLSPIAKWELEGHMAWKVCTLRKQTVPLAVRESWAMLNYLSEVQREVPEPEKTQVQLSMPMHQSTEQNSNNKSSDLSSFQLKMNIGVESGLSRTKTKISQSLIPAKPLQPGDGPQMLGLKPLVTSMGTRPPQSVGVDIIQEETTFLQKDPKHILELSIEQRVIGLPEKNIQQQKTQVTNMELTPRLPCQDTDSIKVTPLALLQVMDSMGMIPESHSEVIESVGLFTQLQNKAMKRTQGMKTMTESHKPLFEVTKAVEVIPVSQCQIKESKMLMSRSVKQDTDNVKVTPVALLQVMDSMGMTEKSHPCILGSVEMTPRPQYPDKESMKMNTLSDHQVLRPGKMSSQHTATETVEMTPESQHKVIESVGKTSSSQSKVKELEAIPASICQKTESSEMISGTSPQVMDYMKVTPVALLQTMDSMGLIPPAQPHITRPAGLTPDSQSQVATLDPRITQSDVLTSNCPTTPGSLGFAESVDLSLKAIPKVMKSEEKVSAPSHYSIHSLKITPRGSPVGIITALQPQDVQTKDLTPTLASQDKESLEITPIPWTQVLDSIGMTSPSHQHSIESMSLTSGSLPQAKESLRLTPEHQILEHLEMIPKQSHQVMETTGLTSDTCLQRKKSVELTQLSHQVIESLGTIPTSLGQGIESMGINQKPQQRVTESAVKTTVLLPQSIESAPKLTITDAIELPPGLQNAESGKLTLGPKLQCIRSVDVTTNSTPHIVKYEQLIPGVNSKELPPEFQPLSVKSAELSQASQWQSKKPIEVIPSSQSQGIRYAPLTLGLPSVRTVEEALRSPKEGKESVDLVPEPCLQNIRSKDRASVLSPEEVKTPQMVACRKQDIKHVEVVPGAYIPTVLSVELKPKPNNQIIKPEGLTSCNQTPKAWGMILEPVKQETESKLTFDTCHEVKESVGATQTSLGYISGSLSPTSKFLQMNPLSPKCTPETLLQSVKIMGEMPVMQHTSQGSLGLVPGPEKQSVKSEMFTPEFQRMKFVHLDAEPYSGVVNYEELITEPQFENVESMPLTSGPQSQSIEPERLTLEPLMSEKQCMDFTPQEESRPFIPEPQLLHAESRRLSMEPHLQVKGFTTRPTDQETAPAELASAIWPQKEESMKLTPQQVTEIAGVKPRHYFQKISRSTPGLGYHDTKTVRPTYEALAQKSTGQTMESTGMIVRPHLQVTETSVRPESENIEMVGGALFPVKNIQQAMPAPSYSQKVSLRSEMKYKKTEPLLEILKSVKLTSKLAPIVLGSKQFTTELKPHVGELGSRPQSQEVKPRQLGPESKLQDMKCANLIQQSIPKVVDSEKVIQQTVLSSTRPEALTKDPQLQGVKSIPGPLLQSVRFSKSSPRSFLQGKKPLGFTPQCGVKSNEVTPGSPIQEIKLSDCIPGQKHQSIQLTPEPQTQGGKFRELSSGPCLQDVIFPDLTPEPKNQDFKCVQSIPKTQFKDVKTLKFVAELPLQSSQLFPVRDMKSVLSPIVSQFYSKEHMKSASQLHSHSVKSEEIHVGPRQEEVKFSELTSGPKLQGVKFGEQAPGFTFHGVKPVAVIPELGRQDSSSVKGSPKLQDKKQAGHNLGPRLQDVKFRDLILETQPQSVKSSELKAGPQLQCVKFSELPPESNIHGIRSVELCSDPEQQGVKPKLSVPHQQFQDHTPRFESDITYKLASKQQKPDAKYMGLTHELQLPSVNSCELGDRKSSELIQQRQLQDTKTVEWIPVSKLHFKSDLLTSEPQVVDKNSATSTLGNYLKDIKSMFQTHNSHLEDEKSVKTTSGPQLQDLTSVEAIPDSECEDANLDDFTLHSRTEEFKAIGLVPGIQLKSSLEMQGDNSVPFALGPLCPKLHLQVGKHEELTSESQIQDSKFVEKTSCLKIQSLKSAKETTEPEMQHVKSANLIPKLKRQVVKSANAARRQKPQGVQSIDLAPRQQFHGMEPMNLTPGSQKDSELSGISLAQQYGNSEQLRKGTKSEDGLYLELIPKPIINSSKLTQQPEQLQVKPLELTSEAQLQDMTTLISKQESPFKSRNSVQWTPKSELEGVKSLGLNVGSQAQGVQSADSMSLVNSRDTKSSGLTLVPQTQGTTFTEFNIQPQLQRGKNPELNPGPQLQKEKLFVSASAPPLQDMKTVATSQDLQLGSMESSQWMPVLGFQGMNSLLGFGSQSQPINPIEWKPLLQLKDVTSSLLTPSSKFQYHEPQVDLNRCLQFRDMKSCDLALTSEPCDVKSIMSKPMLQLQDEKSPEFNPRSHPQEVKLIQSCLGAQLKGVKSPMATEESLFPGLKAAILNQRLQLPSNKTTGLNSSLYLKSMKTSESTLQKNLQGVKSEEFNSVQGLKPSKKPFEAESQDIVLTGLNTHSQLQSLPFSKENTGTNIQGLKSKDVNIGSLLQGMKCSERTSEIKLQGAKSKECCHGTRLQVVKSSELILGPTLQDMKLEFSPESQLKGLTSSRIIPDTKLQDTESKKFKPEPQLQGAEYSKLKLGAELQKIKSVEYKSGPQLQDIKSSELITGIQLDDVKSMSHRPERQSQRVKSFESLLREKLQGVRSVELKFSPVSQDKKSSGLTLRKNFPGTKSVESRPDPQLENIKCSELIMGIKLRDTKSTGFRSRSHFQGIKPAEVIPQSKFQEVKSVLNSGPQSKKPESMKLQIKNSTEVSHGPEFQVAKLSGLALESKIHNKIPSELTAGKQWQDEKPYTVNPWPDLQNLNFMFNPGPHLQHTNSSELCKETKLQDMKLLKFAFNQQLKNTKSSQLCLGTKLQDMKSLDLQSIRSELNLESKPPDIKSKTFCLGHLQDMTLSALIPDPKLQYPDSLEYNPVKQLQAMNCSELTAASKLEGMKSSELNPETEIQSEPFQVCTPEQQSQDLKSGFIAESWSFGVVPTGSSVGPQMQGSLSSALYPRSESQCINPMEYIHTPPTQDVKLLELTLGTKCKGITSSELNPETEIQSKPLMVCSPEHLQSVNSSELTSETKCQDTRFEGNLGTKIQSEISKMCSPGPQRQGLRPGSISETQFLHEAGRSCSPGPQTQCVNSSMLNQGSKSQCVNSVEYTHAPPLQGINSFELTSGAKCKCIKSSDLNQMSELKGTRSSIFDFAQFLHNIKCEMTPGTKLQGTASMEINSDRQPRGVNPSELNSLSERLCVNSITFNVGPDMQGTKPSDSNPGSESQGESILLNSEPHLHDVKSSELASGTKFPEVECLENNPWSQQQVVQSVFTSGVESGVSAPGVTHEEVKSEKVKNEALACSTNSGKLTSGCEMQGIKSEVSTHESGFQKVKPMQLSPGSNPQRVNCRKFPSHRRQHRVRSVASDSESTFPGAKSLGLKVGRRPQDVNSKKLNPCFRHKSMVLESNLCSQDVKSIKSDFCSQPQSFSEFPSCPSPQCVNSEISVPEPCHQDIQSVELIPESQQWSTRQELHSGWENMKSVASAPEPTKKLLSGPMMTSVKISNLSLESQNQQFQGVKSLEVTPESNLQSIKHVALSSVSLQQAPKSVKSAPGSLLQIMESVDSNPRTSCQMVDSFKTSLRPKHQVIDYKEMILKPRNQVIKSMNLVTPVYQVTEASDTAQRLECQSTKSVKKSVELTPNSSHKFMEPLESPLELDQKVPEFTNLTPMLGDQGLSPLENSNQIPEILNLLSQKTWPKVKDLGELYKRPLQQVVESEGMTPQLHITETLEFASEVRPHMEEFLGMALKTKSTSKATRYLKRSSRPYPQVIGAIEITSGKRAQREESVTLFTKPSNHVPEFSEMIPVLIQHVPEPVGLTSKTGLQMKEPMKLNLKSQDHVESSGLGYQVLEYVDLTPKQCTQKEESLELPPKQTSQLEGNIDSLQPISVTWKQGEGSMRPTQLQMQSMKSSERAPGPLDQTSPKSLEKITRPTKTQLQVTQQIEVVIRPPEKVVEYVKVTPGPPLQVVNSVPLVPESTSQMAGYAESSKPQKVRPSEYMSGIWLQNAKSKKLTTEPTHLILETTELAGFQIVKTVLNPEPPLQIANSEELTPRPMPQVVELKGDALGTGIKVIDCLDLLPTSYIKKLAQPPRSNAEVKSAQFTSQPTPPFSTPTVLTYEEQFQTVNSIGKKTGPSQVMEPVGLNLGQVCQNRESEELISGELQVENYFSRFLYSSSNSFISNSAKTSFELGELWDSEDPEVARTLNIKNLRRNILHPGESFLTPEMIQSSIHSLAFHDQFYDMTETTQSEIPRIDVLSKERTKRKQVEEIENSFQSLFQHLPQRQRSPSKAYQAGSGARRGLSSSFLGRKQNVWENHSQRQRLPRKYLSTMLMLGNVLGTNMERTLCPSTSLMERTTASACQSIHNLFGIPTELMEFSQSLLEKARGAISQPSVVKHYIQRHTSFHSDEKGLALKMWTRSSLSSIIQQYCRSQVRIKERNPEPCNIPQETIQHIPVSYKECQLPVSVKSGSSSLNLLFVSKDPILMGESVSSHDSQTRIIESQHSLKSSYLSQSKNDFSEQFQLLQDLQLKIAAKLLRCQIPHDVPPPLASGLVLKYPICLQCGRCSGFNCCHKLQATFGPYLLIYPQLHLVSTPEGHGEIRLHLGFRLRTGKRPQVPKYHRRDTSGTPRSSKSPSLRKTKIYTQASKSPTSTIDFQSEHSQYSPIHTGTSQRQRGIPILVGKTGTGELGHYESTLVQSLPETDSENSQYRKRAKGKIRKTPHSRYSKKNAKGSKTSSTKSYINNKTTVQRPSRELPTQLRKTKSGTSQTTTPLKRQPINSPQPRFIQLLFKGIKQAFQTAHRFVALVGQKPEDSRRPDHLWPSKKYYPRQKNVDYRSVKATTKKISIVKLRSTDSTTKQENMLWEETKQLRSAQQPKSDSSFQSRLICQPKSTASQKSTISKTNSSKNSEHPRMAQNDSSNKIKKNYRNETPSHKSKNSKTGTRDQVQERVLHGSAVRKTSQFKEKPTHKEQNHTGVCRDRNPYSPSERSQNNLSDRSHLSVSGGNHPSPSQRSQKSPCERKCRSPSERRCRSPSERRCRSSSERRGRNPSEKTYPTPSEKNHPGSYEKRQHKLSEKNHRNPSERSQPSNSEKSGPSYSGRSGHSQSGKSQHSHSERSRHSRSEKSEHSHSERSRRSHSGKRGHSQSEKTPASSSVKTLHSSSQERVKSNGPKERPRHLLFKDVKSHSKLSSGASPPKPKAGQSQRPAARSCPLNP
ncbi:uncharacterized protein C2orf16 homolog [Erinaceus europaeus]|uniref:Uncharacterized protein C2orf16 homolog n=1 Tax=Erinaceus europaeus TaxID=9365 RepID=A0ABM3X1P9_ERIEU|nr:uncharacterized protein C2orf16 homolog [Erinaceus europaeus]